MVYFPLNIAKIIQSLQLTDAIPDNKKPAEAGFLLFSQTVLVIKE